MKTIEDVEELILIAKALGNPIRLEVLFILSYKDYYVSELARKLKVSRALLYLHLNKLEEAQLINGNIILSKDGKALKYYSVNKFNHLINNDLLIRLAAKYEFQGD